MSSEWDNIGGAAISQTGPKFNAGHNYLVEVVAVKDQQSHHGNFFIVETVVHESNDPDLPADTRPSYSGNKKYPQTKGRILCFAGALFGIDPKDEAQLRGSIKGEHIVALIHQNAGKGRFVHVITGGKETAGGHDFVLHDFAPYRGPALQSRLNNPVLAAGNSAAAAQAAAAPAPVSMPGAFVPPGAGLPAAVGFPSNGLPMPAGLMGLSTVPPAGASIPQMGAAPSFPSVGGAPPSFPSVGGFPPSFGGAPQMGAMPSFPSIPQVAPAPKPWPPTGWAVLPPPNPPGYHYKLGTQEYLPDAELRAKQAAGQV